MEEKCVCHIRWRKATHYLNHGTTSPSLCMTSSLKPWKLFPIQCSSSSVQTPGGVRVVHFPGGKSFLCSHVVVVDRCCGPSKAWIKNGMFVSDHHLWCLCQWQPAKQSAGSAWQRPGPDPAALIQLQRGSSGGNTVGTRGFWKAQFSSPECQYPHMLSQHLLDYCQIALVPCFYMNGVVNIL